MDDDIAEPALPGSVTFGHRHCLARRGGSTDTIALALAVKASWSAGPAQVGTIAGRVKAGDFSDGERAP